MTYNHDSHKSTTERTKFPAAQISRPSDVAWSAAANDGQAERDVMNHTSGVNGTETHTVCVCVLTSAEPLRLTHRTPGVRSNPG